MENKRINVGLFVGKLDNPFDNAVCEGAMRGAKEADVNLMIFPGRYLKGQYYERERTRAEYQNNALFSYVDKKNIDVLVILMGTVGTVLTDAEKKVFLDMYTGIPIFLLADEMEGYGNITFDNRSGLRDGIADLIERKKRKCIGMFSGPMTNDDAVERLNVYRETLEAHGMEVLEKRIGYGDFSEFCEDKVKELIQNNPEMDAIVFANDQMAIGGYNAIKDLGLRIGEDIAVMGFDDSPVASVLEPKLTSVKADATEMGRLGILEAVKFYRSKEVTKSVLHTSLVQRQSSGNSGNVYFSELQTPEFEKLVYTDDDKTADVVIEKIFGKAYTDEEQSRFLTLLKRFASSVIRQVKDTAVTEESRLEAIGLLKEAVLLKGSDFVVLNEIYTLFDTLKLMAETYAGEKYIFASKILYDYMKVISATNFLIRNEEEAKQTEIMYTSNSLTRDMLVYGEDNDMSYQSVTVKLEHLGIKSAYLYTFVSPHINHDATIWHDWQIPAYALLKSYYHEPGKIEIVSKKKQRIESMNLFSNEFMPQDRRYTLILNTIFINEEQLGILLCEIEHNQIPYLEPIMAQLSSAFKIIFMLHMQVGIQKQLEVSLKKIQASNQMLETISKMDELTGIFNRRGFFEQAPAKIRDSKNNGKKAILLFADLDNLKTINDQMGHEEGDFAIKSVAEILKDSMRASDVVARIGGDEFVAMAILEKHATAETIKMRIKNLTEQFNEICEKPYYIGVSVGVSEFVCDKDVELETYLDMADENLYEDKQGKRTNILK